MHMATLVTKNGANLNEEYASTFNEFPTLDIGSSSNISKANEATLVGKRGNIGNV